MRNYPAPPGTIDELLVNLAMQGQRVRKIEIDVMTREIKVVLSVLDSTGNPVWVQSEHTALPIELITEIRYTEEQFESEEDSNA